MFQVTVMVAAAVQNDRQNLRSKEPDGECYRPDRAEQRA